MNLSLYVCFRCFSFFPIQKLANVKLIFFDNEFMSDEVFLQLLQDRRYVLQHPRSSPKKIRGNWDRLAYRIIAEAGSITMEELLGLPPADDLSR
jgi:hypothetical protein